MKRSMREIYDDIYASEYAKHKAAGATNDKASRKANIKAVKTTRLVWEQQFKKKETK